MLVASRTALRLVLLLASAFAAIIAAAPYARAIAPAIGVTAQLVARWNGWRVDSLHVAEHQRAAGEQFELATTVPGDATPAQATAHVVSRASIAGPVRTALVVLAVVILWPAPGAGRYVLRLVIAVPAGVATSAIIVGTALLGASASAAAELAGRVGETPWLERWAEVTESGGAFAISLVASLLVIATADGIAGLRHVRKGRHERCSL